MDPDLTALLVANSLSTPYAHSTMAEGLLLPLLLNQLEDEETEDADESSGDDDEEPPPPRKRLRHNKGVDEKSSSNLEDSAAVAITGSPSSILPPPTKEYVELRLQLARFKNVYRIVRLPITFTFAHLYQFCLYSFGWSGQHLHQFEVLTNVEMYSAQYKPGEIKSWSIPVPPEPDSDDEQAHMVWYFRSNFPRQEPYVRVVPKLRKRRDGAVSTHDEFDCYTLVKEEGALTLGQVWSNKERRNITKGDCNNHAIAIRLEYDLGASWSVDISLSDPEKYWWKYDTPDNHPKIIKAKGAPPIEDARGDVPGSGTRRKQKVGVAQVFRLSVFRQIP
ncbi:unnamed protein product [Somion occarium]|uniref:Plasmid pRiA4b Orf3-like domain-containing protein n=1 Tax=Somion occarium TaxID=3059160 RepID=A0ABP1E162_9APHY